MSIASILLLEDDEVLGKTILEILTDAHYDVDLAVDGVMAAELCYEKKYDLYIFDINVPEVDGVELLKELRQAGDETPTIYITALVDLDSISRGFAAGAEDYLKKPFYPEELLMRVNARMQNHLPDTIYYRDIVYHPQSKEIFKEDKIFSLGIVQMRLFDELMHNIGKVIHKERLLDLLENPSDTALRVAMTKLKQKLDLEVTNVRGVGYILEKV
jgi:DNA-binding response OmpR family regulator